MYDSKQKDNKDKGYTVECIYENSVYENDDEYAEDDNKDVEFEGVGNKDTFLMVAFVMVPVFLICMVISLFSNGEGKEAEVNVNSNYIIDNSNNNTDENTTEDGTEDGTEDTIKGTIEDDVKKYIPDTEDLLNKIKEDIKDDFSIDWSQLRIKD